MTIHKYIFLLHRNSRYTGKDNLGFEIETVWQISNMWQYLPKIYVKIKMCFLNFPKSVQKCTIASTNRLPVGSNLTRILRARQFYSGDAFR